jgi:glycosyltransferase involved in cell wall biosynthesis
MLEFCAAIEESNSDEFEFIFTHNPTSQAIDTYFRGDISGRRKLLYHLYFFIWKQFILPVKVRKHKPDALICFDFVAPALPLKVHKLVIIHDAFFWQMPQHYKPAWRNYFLKSIHEGLKGKTTVITTSQYSKETLIEIAHLQKPIEVVYQCPRLLPENESTEVLEQFDLAPSRYLLHVGSFDRRKLLPVLIQAFHSFLEKHPHSLKLVLVGERGLSASVDDYEKIKQTIQDFNLKVEVILTGFLPDAAVKSLYKNAYAYVFPSSNEGFGIPVIEAMVNDLPVIISDQKAMIEIAGGAALISKTANVEDLADKIAQLWTNPTLREDLVNRGRKRREDFSRKAFFNSFLKLLKQG